MRVFIIGGNGFVGSAFARLLRREKVPHEIITRENRGDFRGRRCDVLINANGNSRKFLADRDPVAEFEASVTTVVDSLNAFSFDRYVLCSSCDVYNDLADPARNHEDVEIDPDRLSRYGFHKLLAERIVRREAADHLIIRFGGFVGPGLKKNPIYDILHGGPLWLDPDSALQYIPTDAAAAAVWRLVTTGRTREVYNVCGDGLLHLREVLAHLGRDVPVSPGSPRVVYDINIEKIKRECPIPASRESVFRFVDSYARAVGARVPGPG